LNLSLKKFALISLIVHLLIGVVIYFVPAKEEKKQREFITSLVTPQKKEAAQPLKKPALPQPLIRPLPKPMPARPLARPRPAAPPGREAPAPPPVAARPPHIATPPDAPLVPGEVRESGGTAQEEGSTHKGKGIPGERGVADTKNAVESGKPGIPGLRDFFDRKITDTIAKRDTGKAGKGAKKDEVFTFETSPYRFAGYMNKLRDKIESIWQYPPEAAEHGLYGDLKIRFTIRKNGNLDKIELVRTSGYKMLDQAALKALKDGEPYWPLPDEWGMDTYTIEGHFIYSLYGSRKDLR